MILRLVQVFNVQNCLTRLKLWTLGAGIIIMIYPLWLDLSMRWSLSLLPKDQGKSIESIVILGRGPDSRTERALVASRLWHERQKANIFVSGMTDAPRIIKHLREMNISEAQVSGEKCSQTTWENGLFSDVLINPNGSKRILLVTDKPHMVRAFLVFQGFGFDIVPHPIQQKPENPFSLAGFKILLREHAALAAYAFSNKFYAGPAEKQYSDRAKADYKVASWGCHLQWRP